ncbi:MAG: hypothetical protein AAFN92_03840, partial [Bacteroidota bacterium]
MAIFKITESVEWVRPFAEICQSGLKNDNFFCWAYDMDRRYLIDFYDKDFDFNDPAAERDFREGRIALEPGVLKLPTPPGSPYSDVDINFAFKLITFHSANDASGSRKYDREGEVIILGCPDPAVETYQANLTVSDIRDQVTFYKNMEEYWEKQYPGWQHRGAEDVAPIIQLHELLSQESDIKEQLHTVRNKQDLT